MNESMWPLMNLNTYIDHKKGEFIIIGHFSPNADFGKAHGDNFKNAARKKFSLIRLINQLYFITHSSEKQPN